jgi:hypothetical protein
MGSTCRATSFGGQSRMRSSGSASSHLERAGDRPAQGLEVRAAAEGVADVGAEGADIGALGAPEPEGRIGRGEAEQGKLVDVDEAGLALHDLPLAGELVEGDAGDLHGGDHGRRLHLVADAQLHLGL